MPPKPWIASASPTTKKLSFLIVSDEEIDERYSIPLIRSSSRGKDAVLTLEAARANGDYCDGS